MSGSCLTLGGRKTGGQHAFLAVEIMGFLLFPGGKFLLENRPKLEQKQIYLHVLPSTRKVTVFTSSATNVNTRLNHIKLLLFDHVRPEK